MSEESLSSSKARAETAEKATPDSSPSDGPLVAAETGAAGADTAVDMEDSGRAGIATEQDTADAMPEDSPAEVLDGEDGWKPRDFRGLSSNLSASEASQLETSRQEFSGELASRWTQLFHQKIQVGDAELHIRQYGEFLERVPEISSLYLVRCAKLQTSFFLMMSPELLLRLVERLLGAPPEESAASARALTELEESLALVVLKRVLDVLAESWTSEGSLGLEFADSGTNAEADHVASFAPDTPMAQLGCEVELEGVAGELTIVIPQGPLLTALSGPPISSPSSPSNSPSNVTPGSPPTGDPHDHLLGQLADADVHVSAALETKPLPLKALLSLEAGDVIDTGISVESPIDLSIDKRPIARGNAGIVGNRIAVRIV